MDGDVAPYENPGFNPNYYKRQKQKCWWKGVVIINTVLKFHCQGELNINSTRVSLSPH